MPFHSRTPIHMKKAQTDMISGPESSRATFALEPANGSLGLTPVMSLPHTSSSIYPPCLRVLRVLRYPLAGSPIRLICPQPTSTLGVSAKSAGLGVPACGLSFRCSSLGG